jgi:hypothetical protein
MTRWYWQQRGGTLVEEFPAVKRGPTWSPRWLDGLILLGGSHRIAHVSEVSIEGQDVVIVQTKNSRLGMYLMGQTLFSIELIRPFSPKSIESVALCSADDTILRPLLERFPECRVVVCPAEICSLSKTNQPDPTRFRKRPTAPPAE